MPSNGEADEARIRAYLLGRLPPDEAAEIARSMAHDPDLRESVEAIEEELFDDHVRGRLSAADASIFRSKYLTTPQGRARAEFASAFAKSSTSPKQHSRVQGFAVRFAAAAVIAAASFYAGRLWYDPVVAVDLRPGVLRSTPLANTMQIPASAAVVEFRLYPEQVAGDRATLLTLDENEVASGRVSPLPDGGRRFTVPADILKAGTWIIRLDNQGRTVGTFVVRLQNNNSK